MNQNQFANVLIKSMPYYSSYHGGIGYIPYMCHAIIGANTHSNWECKRAIAKIEKLIHPKPTLYCYFLDSDWIDYETHIASPEYQKKALVFWTIQIALGKKYPSPTIEKLSSYLTHDNPVGWETAQQILNRYVK